MNERERNSLNNPYDVTPEENGGYPFTQADQTDEIDTLANDAGVDAKIESEDFCQFRISVWKNEEFFRASCGSSYKAKEVADTVWRYCPICGKEIKYDFGKQG